MCDGLDHNLPKEFETLLCRCNAHLRRKFVDMAASFPAEVRFALNTFKEIYKTDAHARKECLTPAQRLKLHQDESQPRMEALHSWMKEQFAQHKVEPNSGLGDALSYMDKNWEGLTRFLHVEGAALDSNIVARSLKRAIQHRRNSLFYKNLNGARVGDTFMSLIHQDSNILPSHICLKSPFSTGSIRATVSASACVGSSLTATNGFTLCRTTTGQWSSFLPGWRSRQLPN
jgi:transposase